MFITHFIVKQNIKNTFKPTKQCNSNKSKKKKNCMSAHTMYMYKLYLKSPI